MIGPDNLRYWLIEPYPQEMLDWAGFKGWMWNTRLCQYFPVPYIFPEHSGISSKGDRPPVP